MAKGRTEQKFGGDNIVLFLLTPPAQIDSSEAAAGTPWSVREAGSLAIGC